ncbi:MAG TPA: endonuclease/exonuclease/phosphatase family protein [Candidatus Saccharimonadales bacterium]
MRVVSWNIAGGHKMRSAASLFDYAGLDLDYFIDQLRAVLPDIVCLQETHSRPGESIAADIARALDLPYVYEVAVSPSHIDDRYRLGNAILSRWRLQHVADLTYPFPDFALRFKDGQPAQRHDKMAQLYQLDGVMIANTQMMPFDVFGVDHKHGAGAQNIQQIEQQLLVALHAPLILCGDLNMKNASKILAKLYAKLSLRDVLPPVPTRPLEHRLKSDYILVSPTIMCKKSSVVPAQADHFLCLADLEARPYRSH